MSVLTDDQIRRQDFVDNQVFELIQRLAPPSKEISWNIEMIAEVREMVRVWMVERLKIADEMNFYPYLKP